MKNRIISVILLLALLLSLCPQGMTVAAEAADTELSQGQQNIVKRARQMVEIEWTPKKNIAGWRYEYTYYAGTTYTGLPYGQPVNASYVPWETSLDGFLAAVNDTSSKMYTSYSAYTARAPYYSVDCSGFVSWAWDLPSRCPSSSLTKYGTKISSSSYKNAQVGDCLLDPGVHAALITDLKYDSNGNIIAIEVSDSGSSSGCRSRWYGEGNGYRTLDYFVKAYFKSGYSLYRSKTRDSVTYTHSCAVPLAGDNCSKCGAGNGTDDPTSCVCSTSYAGTYICTATSTGLAIRSGHGTSYSKAGTIAPGAKVTVTAGNGKWAHVEYGGVSGYASLEYLELSEAAPGVPSCDCSDSYAGTYICKTSSGTLTIRSGHDSSYSKLGSIPSGSTVTVTAGNGKWAHVEWGGVSGYVSMDYLEPGAPDQTVPACDCTEDHAGTYICTTTSDPLAIRAGHGSSYDKVGTVPPGGEVTVTAANGSWAHVEYNGISGYASMDYLAAKEENATLSCGCSESYAGTYICTTSSGTLTVRSGHGTSYSKVGSIPSGAEVTVTAGNGEWAHVEYGGISGYASMDYLFLQAEQEISPDMVHWISKTSLGETVASVKQGETVYLNYLIYDIISEANLNDVSDLDYTVKLTVTGPGGATVNSVSYTGSDLNSLSVKCSTAGTYTYTVKVTGDITYDATDSFTVAKTSLATPSISKVENTASGVKVTWGKVTGAAKYKVFIKNTSGSGWTGIGTTSGTTFTYTGAKSGTKYTFTVRCLSEDGKTYTSSYNSTGKSITYIAQPKVTKLENTDSGVKLTWGKVTGAARYRVYVKNSNGNWVNIGNTTGNTFTYKSVTSGTKYTFTVRCVNAANTAFTSSHNSAGWSTTYIAQPKVTKLENTASGVKITWGKVTGAEKYRVYVKTEGGTWQNIGTTTGNTFTYTGAKSGTKYTFTVRCLNAKENAFTSSFNAVGWSTTFISQPTVSKLQSTSAGIKLTWGAVPGAARYRVYVKNSSGNWVNIGTTIGNTFTYTGAEIGKSYTFTVRCVNAANTAFTSYCNTTGWTTTYTG